VPASRPAASLNVPFRAILEFPCKCISECPCGITTQSSRTSIRHKNRSNCCLPRPLAGPKRLADVHSASHSLLLSHSGYPRPATRANSSRSEADARRHVRRKRSGRGYAKKVRAVPAWLKRQAYAEYGITQYKTGDYEVDHLIALSLGGSNSIRNLWPESTKTTPWNSYVKDALEWKLHKLVCAGQLDLKTAQSEIASNWIEAYQKNAAKSPPTPRLRETKPAPATATASEVWVNTRSGKYWKPGSRFYGKLKRASLCRSWMRLIVDIPQQVERGNRLCQETRSWRK
jgi:hypothetical protein